MENNVEVDMFLEAIRRDDVKLLQELINRGFDVNIKLEEGVTPLIFAVTVSSYKVVKLLVEMKLSSKKELESYNHTFDHFDGYKKLMRFANKELAEEIEGYNTKIRTEIEQKHHEEIYKVAETFSRFQTSKNQQELYAHTLGTIWLRVFSPHFSERTRQNDHR